MLDASEIFLKLMLSEREEGYFLSPAQIQWVENNTKRFSEKVPFTVGTILVVDKPGGIAQQTTMYFKYDENAVEEDVGVYTVKYVMTSTQGGTVVRGEWDDEVEGGLPRPRNSYWQGALGNEMNDRIALLNPTTLHDGDRKFEELKRMISRCR